MHYHLISLAAKARELCIQFDLIRVSQECALVLSTQRLLRGTCDAEKEQQRYRDGGWERTKCHGSTVYQPATMPAWTSWTT